MKLPQHIHWAALLLAGTMLAGCTKDNVAPKSTSTATQTTTDEMVLTPAGMMPKANVHFIEPGSELRVSGDGRLQKVESATGKMLQDFGPVTQQTGGQIHFGSDANFDLTRPGNGVVPKAVNGWAAYAYWSNTATTNPITSFTTTWTVPNVPSDQGAQTIFLFNGMQDGTSSSSYIIQPVLQWGSSAAGGGKYWAITNWYVSSASAYYGTLEKVSAGTSLTGVMTETGKTGSNYNYTSTFTGYPSAQSITASNVPEAYWAAETLEVYSVTKATMYPNSTSMEFSGIQILQGTTNATIKWTADDAVGTTPSATIGSNSSPNGYVTIKF